MAIKTAAFGYPRIGRNRELKNAIESYWKKEISKEEMLKKAEEVNIERMQRVIDANLDYVPSNDFSLYDFVLDISTMIDAIPQRFRNIGDELDRYFAMARGSKDAIACEMTKWFDTNYHYIVPELDGGFRLVKNVPLVSYKWAKEKLGVETRPILVGAFTYVVLSKVYENREHTLQMKLIKAVKSEKFEIFLFEIASIYNQIIRELYNEGVRAVQFDEPALVLDLEDEKIDSLIQAYKIITNGVSDIDIFVHTYYESLDNFERITNELPVAGIGLDFVVSDENLINLKNHGFPKDKKLQAGVISGRDPWKTDYREVLRLIEEITKYVDEDRIILSNAAPLFHLPVSLEPEKAHLDESLFGLLSFADERLEEIRILKEIINEGKKVPSQNLQDLRDKFKIEEVRKVAESIDNQAINRSHDFKRRYEKQLEILGLPKFPTTTIGSFPQTKEVRQMRAKFRKGEISTEEYENFIREQIRKAIDLQEELGLDVLVHGEFERADMVEFFAEKMRGFACTHNGWVQSYGTRCVKPPIIYGDVSRPQPMTVKEIVYAQSLTRKPVKGVLTGPITILNWSFFRKDIPKKEIAYQIALALKEEVLDLEKAGIKIIQIDEPAFREGLPLKKRKQEEYLQWAVKAFRLTHATVKETTQIHTHMCYSDFNEIIMWIYEMDADVISIETARSKGEVIEAFENFKYDKGVGIGVYDIHSPRIPSIQEMLEIVERAIQAIKDKNLIWINPDCGLKTRQWEEIVPALRNMVEVAKVLREKI